MKHTLSVLLATVAMTGIPAAYAATEKAEVKSNVEMKDDGGYESTRTSERTSKAGTKQTSKSTVDVDVDSDGKVEKSVNSKVVTDPKGLMNKKKNESETNIEEKKNGGYKQVTTRNHVDADGTNTTYETTTDVDIDSKGNVTTTAETKKTVDPEGLMNKTTTTSTTKSVNGKVVEKTTKKD